MSDLKLTKREYFAIQCLQGICAFSGSDGVNQPMWHAPSDVMAKWAVEHADALIAELGETDE
jgi:hypothetical protein